jgi:hypothetical protein
MICVCLSDNTVFFGVLDLQGCGDSVLEHLNPAGLPRASGSQVFPFLAQIFPTS